MKKIKTIIFATFLLFSFSAYSEEREIFNFNETLIGSILERETASGCGCYFYYPKENESYGSSILQTEIGEKGILHINGKTIRPIVVGKGYDSQSKVGGKAKLTLKDDNVDIKAYLTAVKVCGKEHESCKVTDYSVTLDITTKSGKISIPAWGQCGC